MHHSVVLRGHVGVPGEIQTHSLFLRRKLHHSLCYRNIYIICDALSHSSHSTLLRWSSSILCDVPFLIRALDLLMDMGSDFRYGRCSFQLLAFVVSLPSSLRQFSFDDFLGYPAPCSTQTFLQARGSVIVPASIKASSTAAISFCFFYTVVCWHIVSFGTPWENRTPTPCFEGKNSNPLS